MLTIMLPATDDEPAVTLEFEHSLVSLSKWEALHEKAFFGKEPQTSEETISYVKQMLLTKNPPENWVGRLVAEHFVGFNEYINSKQTATFFQERPDNRPSREIVTNELVYQWMIEFRVPFKPCDEWHFNHLMTLIKVCGIKEAAKQPKKKMSTAQMAEERRRLNAQRREQMGTSG